jgi:WS/DGAT/MGAT family acyltransferase
MFIDSNPRRRLSPQDIAFLYLESEQTPMTIGSIAVFEGQVPFDRFVENIQARLHIIPRYRQRVVEAPYGITRPTWEFDRHFDIRNHIRPLSLGTPASERDVTESAGRLVRGRMDMRRPLWEMDLVHDVEGDRTALISRMHHCMVDGVGGVELLMVTLDVQENPPIPVEAPVYEPPPPSPRWQRISDAVFSRASEAVDHSASVADWLVDLATGEWTGTRRTLNALGTTLSYLFNPVPKFSFNRSLGGGRQFAFLELPWADTRAIRQEAGGTVNDVVLATLAGALTQFAIHHGESTENREARISMPVNVRRESERAMLGNRISMLDVEVPLDSDDPVQRLRTVIARTHALKESRLAEGMTTLLEIVGVLGPNELKALSAALVIPNTVSNVTCTNVPGPMIPLYTVGHRLLTHHAVMPIAWDMGIGCAVMSYDQHLYVTLVADTASAPDVDLLGEMMRDAFEELRAAVCGPPAAKAPPDPEPEHPKVTPIGRAAA